MTAKEFTNYLDGYSDSITAPVHTGVNVKQVSQTQNGYRVVTSEGEWQCRTLVIATGACNIPVVPKISQALPDSIESINPYQYRNPDQLRSGGVLVVGASATGMQLAAEIQRSGRQVTVATGEHVRMPRNYRGRDIQWWMENSGVLGNRYDEVDDVNRVRNLPSAQLVAGDKDLDINTLQKGGVEFVGRFSFVHNNKAQFSGSVANVCKLSDLKMRRLLRFIDDWAEQQDFTADLPAPYKPEDTFLPASPKLEMDLKSGEIETVLWATGFKPDYSWLKAPVLDHKGMLKHDGGVVQSPGLYVMGLPFMRRRKSQFIDGVADDARDLAAHMEAYLHGNLQRRAISVA